MANKPRPMNARFLRPEDIEAIRRVEAATKNGAVTEVNSPQLNRFLTLRNKVRAIDTSVTTAQAEQY
jgi:hypothetical protein